MSKSFHYRDNYEHEYRGDSKKKKKQKDKTFQNKLGKSKASSFDLIDSFQRIESLLRVTELVKDESLSKEKNTLIFWMKEAQTYFNSDKFDSGSFVRLVFDLGRVANTHSEFKKIYLTSTNATEPSYFS